MTNSVNILAIADLHGEIKPLRDYFVKKVNSFVPDFVALCGDNSGNNIRNFTFENGKRIVNKSPEGFDQRVWLINSLKQALTDKWRDIPIFDLNGNRDFGDRKDIFECSLFKGTKVIEFKNLKIGLMTGIVKFLDEGHDEIEENEFSKRIKKLDKDIDILLTHTPPADIMDLGYGKDKFGSKEIHKSIFGFDDKKPYFNKLKLHCFGHAHGSSGIKSMEVEDRQVVFINTAEKITEYSLIIE